MKPTLYIISLATAFIAGALTHPFWHKDSPDERVEDSRQPTHPPVLERSMQLEASDGPRSQISRAASPSGDARLLKLRPEVVDALLAGGHLKQKLSRMELSVEQIEDVSVIRTEGTKALKNIEIAHSKVVSDEHGDHVAIDAFPIERREWLGKIESDLQSLLGDDRAAIIARMIAFADNDEDVGVHRRELFVTVPANGKGKTLIEEKTFNGAGQHIDSDYEEVDSNSQSRWGHLLDFGNDQKNQQNKPTD